jgi:glucose/arabinose dehydrogenase
MMMIFLSMMMWAQTSKLPFAELVQTQQVIWGFDFVGNEQIIFTERSGQVKLLEITSRKVIDLGKPFEVANIGQGGLLDVVVHPDFKSNQLIYFTYAKKTAQGYTTALGRAQLIDQKLMAPAEVFAAQAESKNTIHFGSRIVFVDSQTAFMTVGDRNVREQAQSKDSHFGKILKLQFAKPTEKPQVQIYSLGHRNPQGLVWDGTQLWSAEFGPRGGDELNLVVESANYGWPVVTYGREYYGPKIGEGATKAGMQDPVQHWVPSISPSGMAVLGERIYLACLSSEQILELTLKDKKVVSQKSLFASLGWRFRAVKAAPKSLLQGPQTAPKVFYASTDDGRLIRWEL